MKRVFCLASFKKKQIASYRYNYWLNFLVVVLEI
jgi:hypothetical protein